MHEALKIFFFVIVGVILYTYAGYPLILFVLGLARRSRPRRGEGYTPSVALIISAYNEERIMREKLRNSLALDYPRDRLRIIVASDGSTDGTNAIAREFETAGIVLKAFPRREGKSATLNKTVLGLEEQIIVFSDANAFYRRDALRALVRNFADEEVGCVVGRLVYRDTESYVGRGESLYWRYEGLLNRLESRLRSVLVATGTIFAIRRELFRPVMKDVANDLQLPAEVAAQGYGAVYEAEAVALESSTYFFREEFARKRRIVIRGLTGYRRLRLSFGGPLRSFQFISRKLLRWWVGALLPVLFAVNIALLHDPLFRAFFILQGAFYACAAIGAVLRRGRYKSRFLLMPFYFVMVNGAALAAIATYLSGRRLAAWDKAETTRQIDEPAREEPVLRVIEGRKKVSNPADNFERIT